MSSYYSRKLILSQCSKSPTNICAQESRERQSDFEACGQKSVKNLCIMYLLLHHGPVDVGSKTAVTVFWRISLFQPWSFFYFNHVELLSLCVGSVHSHRRSHCRWRDVASGSCSCWHISTWYLPKWSSTLGTENRLLHSVFSSSTDLG